LMRQVNYRPMKMRAQSLASPGLPSSPAVHPSPMNAGKKVPSNSSVVRREESERRAATAQQVQVSR